MYAVDTNGDVDFIEFQLAEISQHHIATLEGHTNTVKSSLAFSPDGKKIASNGNPVRLWDVATGSSIATFEHGYVVAFSPTGRILATGGFKIVKLWDVATQRNIATLEGHTHIVESLAFSPDGATLASGSYDGMITLWDVATQRDILTFEAHTRPDKWTNNDVRSLAFSPDGTILASGSSDRMIKLWDVATGTNIASIREEDGRTPYIYSLAFSPDGTILASGKGNGNGNVKLWDVATKRNIAHFKHLLEVYSVAFSPDGQIIASGSRDGMVTLRDVTTGTHIGALPHLSDVWSVAFSPDGRTLASGTRDGEVQLWEVASFLSQEPVDDRDKISISEVMVASNDSSLPQWIELHNRSDTYAVNLKGWWLEIQNRNSVDFDGRRNVTLTFKEKSIEPQETLLIVSKQGRSSNNFQDKQIYNLRTLHHPNLRHTVLSQAGVYLKLRNKAGILIDEVGNLDGNANTDDAPAWHLPKRMTQDGARASMIRTHEDGIPRLGTEETGWISAINTELATGTTAYYGHPDDIGAPGVKSGGALPVTLSQFRAERTDAGILVKWTTESELDNAGFNILRSEKKRGTFNRVNPQLIQGAGTTSERHTYTWTDTTAKPNVVYYYRIEDISHAGVRQQFATVRTRGFVSASGKLTTKWGDLKLQE